MQGKQTLLVSIHFSLALSKIEHSILQYLPPLAYELLLKT